MSTKEVRRRCSYPTSFKLDVIRAARESGNRQASRNFNLNESNVRKWRERQSELEKQNPDALAAGRGRSAFYPHVEQACLQFVASRRYVGAAVSTADLRSFALAYMQQYDPQSEFKASLHWCHTFLARHNLPYTRRKPLQRSQSEAQVKYGTSGRRCNTCIL